MTTIDLNADLGEQVGDDDALLEIVTSANLAAGFLVRSFISSRSLCCGPRSQEGRGAH